MSYIGQAWNDSSNENRQCTRTMMIESADLSQFAEPSNENSKPTVIKLQKQLLEQRFCKRTRSKRPLGKSNDFKGLLIA